MLHASWTDVIVGIVFALLAALAGVSVSKITVQTRGSVVFTQMALLIGGLFACVAVTWAISAGAARAASLCVLGALIPIGYALVELGETEDPVDAPAAPPQTAESEK